MCKLLSIATHLLLWSHSLQSCVIATLHRSKLVSEVWHYCSSPDVLAIQGAEGMDYDSVSCGGISIHLPNDLGGNKP